MNVMQRVHIIQLSSPLGRFALSPAPDNAYFAYSTDLVNGGIMIYDLIGIKEQTYISAHDTPVLLMSFNQTGSLLATASCSVNSVK